MSPARPPQTSIPREPELGAGRGSLGWLVAIMRRLLAPDGCPWDREQTLQSLRPFLLEEAYEVLDALDEGDPDHHAEELGDLLFQIVFQAELAGLRLGQVMRGIGEKLVRRHPHVFGEAEVSGSGEVLANWERIKAGERARSGERRGVLGGVPRAAPALHRAHRLTTKAAKVGFDWPDPDGARAKLDEELGELAEAVEGGSRRELEHEAGDALFALVNWLRKLDVEPEDALRRANARFEERFAHIEKRLEEAGKRPSDATLDEMDALWDEAKAREGGRDGSVS